MTKILVSGLINIETTLRIEGFPLDYYPVTYPFFGVKSTVSGVGYNLTKALSVMGNDVNFLSLIGKDLFESIIRKELGSIGVKDEYILSSLKNTAQSVILYDGDGRRQIHTDLKDLQNQVYPEAYFHQAVSHIDLCALTNINFSRPMLSKAKTLGKLIATDVHAIGSINDAYNQDFMAAADILFMSHENLPVSPVEWIRALWNNFATPISVIGMGKEGALLGIHEDGFIGHFPAVNLRKVVNTIGAGDALFSAFLNAYLKHCNPRLAVQDAIIFAAYKIGSTGAAEGFLNERDLNELAKSYRHHIQPIIYQEEK